MLIRRRRKAEPGIIRYINDQLRTHFFKDTGRLRKNCLITDNYAYLIIIHGQWIISFPLMEISYTFNQFTTKGDQISERHIFTVWYQMHLIIASRNNSIWGEEKCTIEK